MNDKSPPEILTDSESLERVATDRSGYRPAGLPVFKAWVAALGPRP